MSKSVSPPYTCYNSPVSVHKSGLQQLAEAVPLLLGEAGVLLVRLGVLQVQLLDHIQVQLQRDLIYRSHACGLSIMRNNVNLGIWQCGC